MATMNVKFQLPLIIISIFFVCFSCKKSNNNSSTTASTTIANIDSVTGTYTGTTSVDSIYTYTDATGTKQQGVHSFSWPDTLHVTSTDTTSINVVSRFYSVSFPYGDSLTIDYYVTNLQTTTGQNGYLAYNATLTDTTVAGSFIGLNHIVVNIGYSYNKYYYSNFTLYSRP